MTTGRINQVTFVRHMESLVTRLRVTQHGLIDTRTSHIPYTKTWNITKSGVYINVGYKKNPQLPATTANVSPPRYTQRETNGGVDRSLWLLCTFPRPRLSSIRNSV
jgi:hypothetical protein